MLPDAPPLEAKVIGEPTVVAGELAVVIVKAGCFPATQVNVTGALVVALYVVSAALEAVKTHVPLETPTTTGRVPEQVPETLVKETAPDPDPPVVVSVTPLDAPNVLDVFEIARVD